MFVEFVCSKHLPTHVPSLMLSHLTWLALSSVSSRLFSHTLAVGLPFQINWTYTQQNTAVIHTFCYRRVYSKITGLLDQVRFVYFVIEAPELFHGWVDCERKDINTRTRSGEDTWRGRWRVNAAVVIYIFSFYMKLLFVFVSYPGRGCILCRH